MHSYFWSNTIWYVLLGITSIFSLFLIIRVQKNRRFNIAFFFAILAFTYVIEAILLYPFGEAYSYYPKILRHPFLDTMNGNYFSQFSITTTLLLLSIYKLRSKWSFVFAAIYYLIEILFLKLGIYQHHWYRSWITFIGFVIICFVVKKWYKKMLYSPKFWIHYITLYLAALSSFGHLLSIFIYSQVRIIHYNVFPDVFKDQFFGVYLHGFVLINIIINLYRLKIDWIKKGFVFISLFILQYIVCKAGIMYISPGYFFIVTAVDYFGCYFLVAVMDKFLKRSGSGTEGRCSRPG